MKRYRPALLCLILAIFLVDSPVRAEGSEGPPIFLTGMLTSAGVGLDEDSLLQAARSHEELNVRWAAVSVLAGMHSEKARSVFVHFLNSETDQTLLDAAALGLSSLGDEAGLEALESYLEASSALRRRIFYAARLAEFGRAIGYPVILEALLNKNQSEMVRRDAVDALGAFIAVNFEGGSVSEGPRELLLKMAEDPSPLVRSAVLTQVSIAVPEQLPPDQAARVVKRIASEDTDEGVQVQARGLLDIWHINGLLAEDQEGQR